MRNYSALEVPLYLASSMALIKAPLCLTQLSGVLKDIDSKIFLVLPNLDSSQQRLILFMSPERVFWTSESTCRSLLM